MAIEHKMPPSKGSEWEQVSILVPSFINWSRSRGGALSLSGASGAQGPHPTLNCNPAYVKPLLIPIANSSHVSPSKESRNPILTSLVMVMRTHDVSVARQTWLINFQRGATEAPKRYTFHMFLAKVAKVCKLTS